MFQNILRIALRSISKNFLYSFINILGLSLGITSALFLIVYVSDELSYDKYHDNADGIYRVQTHITETDDEFTRLVVQIPFAEQVVVMHDGLVVQTGTPVELFEHPKHTFVGHFIGSPGMNILPAEIINGEISFEGCVVQTSANTDINKLSGKLEIGIRPEFIRFDTKDISDRDPSAIDVEIIRVNDLGKLSIVEVKHKHHSIKLIVPEQSSIMTIFIIILETRWKSPQREAP